MRDNEFEKGVQEKMGEFRLQPSAPVWVEVERRIRERKRRRILILWFCLAGLVLAGLGGWWIGQNNERPERTTVQEQNSSTIKNTIAIDSNNTTETNSLPATVNSELQVNSTQSSDKPAVAEIHKKNDPGNPVAGMKIPVVVKDKQVKQPDQVGEKSIPGLKLIAGSGKKSRKKAAAIDPVRTDIAGNDNPVTQQDISKPVPEDAPVIVGNAPAPVAGTAPVVVTGPVPVQLASPIDTVQEVKPVEEKLSTTVNKSKKSKWQTGFVFAFGQAKLTRGTFSVFSNKSYDALQSGVSSGNGNFNNQSFADSIPLTGPAFHAGIFAKRKTGKRTAFSAGLNLAYYSGKQRVGILVDSVRQISAPFSTNTRDGFYRAGSSDRYTNRYYYIQVPLLFHWQLNKGAKWPPLDWENGLVPSFLAGSRALVYDQAGRIFFRDKSVYNTFSLVYQSGFTATFAGRTKHPLTAGVYYNYHFRGLQKLNPPDFNNLSSYGIQFRWLIKK